MWLLRQDGGRYLNPEYAAERDALVILLKHAILTAKVIICPRRKVQVSIFVCKPNHRGDAANYLDGILDAVERAIGVNDRWFCGDWDWAIDVKNPKIIVKVGQDGD